MGYCDPAANLAHLLSADRGRITRLWAKRLKHSTDYFDLSGADLKRPLAPLLDELVRLLTDRGEDATYLWPEWVRSHGARRYDQGYEPSDLIREFKALEQVLLTAYHRKHGQIEPEVCELICELIGEATAAVEESYIRLLRTEEVRFRDAAVMESVLHQVDVGIQLAEVDGTISFATPPSARLLGMPLRSLHGAKVGQMMPPVLKQVRARKPGGDPFRVADLPLVRALRERAPIRGVQMVIDREGKEILLELNAIPLWEEGEGALAGVIQTFADRTEAAEKTRELAAAYESLRRLQGRVVQQTRSQALGQLASGAAHSLNNYLNVLRLRITLIRRGFKPEHLDALDRTVQKIGALVARLQEFSISRTEETLVEVQFDALVEDSLVLAQAEIHRQAPGVEIETELGAAASVRVDQGFLSELLVSLILAGGRALSSAGHLKIKTWREGPSVFLTVDHERRPFTQEELEWLFDPLKGLAVDPQLSLILAVARHQAERWGGDLSCENRADGKGAVFSLRLPAAETAAREASESERWQKARARPRVKARSVLVVDDDLDNAQMLAQVLGDEGYDVAVAHSGAEALAAWDRKHFDAALLDAVMPDVSGWELAHQLRERAPQVLLAMVTGMDVRGQNRHNLALVDAVFRKPIEVGALDEFLSQSKEADSEEEGEGSEAKPPMLHS